MTNSGNLRCFSAAAFLGLLAALFLAATAQIAAAEESKTPPGGAGAVQQAPDKPAPAAPGPALPEQPPAAEKRGFLNEFGRWWDQSMADFNAKMKDTREKFEDFNKKQNQAAKDATAATQDAMKKAAEATKDAAAAVVRLPNTRVLELRDRCAIAANGAADCQATATNVCRGKGFNSGQPLDVRTSQECPVAVVLSGRSPSEGECPVQTVLLRAVCQ